MTTNYFSSGHDLKSSVPQKGNRKRKLIKYPSKEAPNSLTQLKTLKDMNLGWEGYDPEDERIRKELRYEAVKWVKDKDSMKICGNEINDERMFTPKEVRELINYFIKLFFNLTEEDLK